MNAYFLSYSRRNADEVTGLAQQLKARGLRLWRDVDNLPVGQITEAAVCHAIEVESTGFICYLTPDSMLDSDFIESVELPVAVQRG